MLLSAHRSLSLLSSGLDRGRLLFLGLLLLPAATAAQSPAPFAEIPAEVRSSHFTVSVNGHRTPVLHAASHYYLLNFDARGPATIAVTADDPHFWDRGVEVQPMRHGIRPVRRGATVTFPIPGPIKLSLSRPGDHFAESEMLFLFGNAPGPAAPMAHTPGVRYIAPGIHHENLDARSGEDIYLAPGAVVFGALNLWQVHDVRVFGTGTVIYDGPQDPHTDEGWMHKPNWHCIVMDQAQNIEIDGLTCITRSRTWQVQMKDSRHIGLFNIKVIGGNPNDANQDGLDWLGGGDTTVSDSFFRASDDVFALQGNWEGYQLDLLRKPGHDVTNISIDHTVASTSISNTIRVAWPEKTFSSAHFHMRDMDVIHTGFGGCKVPFAFFELWADPDGKGTHTDYSFHNIRLEDWYSLFQVRQPLPSVRDLRFNGVWAMDGPAMLPPVLLGDVRDVRLEHAMPSGVRGVATTLDGGAAPPEVLPSVVDSSFTYTGGLLHAGTPVTFEAAAPAAQGRRFEWLFGDGRRASGRRTVHRFPDAAGTVLDGSGRFRVLLHTREADGSERWSSQPIVLAHPASLAADAPAAARRTLPRAAALSTEPSAITGRTYTADLTIPADGGYTLTLLTSTSATLAVDGGHEVASPRPRPQVCGAVGDAVQPLRLSLALRAGTHHLRVTRNTAVENAEVASPDEPMLLWEGPGLPRERIPAIALAARTSSTPAANVSLSLE